MVSIIVHGGAWDIPMGEHPAHLRGVEGAIRAGNEVLTSGGDAVDAICAAVVVMEDDPTFDAGTGSFLNTDGEVEMDAMVMDGRLSLGSVAAVRNLKNPVLLARRLMDHPEHCMLVADGAMSFAVEEGFELVPTDDLLTEREIDRFRRISMMPGFRTRAPFEGRDTVGAVALDSDGHVACATSTGGTPNKLPGRVGDSPLVGSGGYAFDGFGAASATGWGESIMKVVLSKTVVDGMPMGCPAACESGISTLTTLADGKGGVIAVSADGSVGFHHNTPFMAVAWSRDGARPTSSMGIVRPV